MAKDADAQLDSSKSEQNVEKLARTTSLLTITEFATNAKSMKLFPMEDVSAEPTTSETTALEYVNFLAQPLNSDTKEDALNAH